MKTYDAIVVGAGHNGLTTAAFLAKAGLDVVCVEKNDYIGGAAVSRNLYKDWIYSNCSYVCSLLRPEIYRELELHRHGLQVTPYGGSVTFMENGDFFGSYHDEEVAYRERARFSRADADAYERYSADTLRQCRFIRDFLLRTPPDPTSFRPQDLRELIAIGSKFLEMGEDRMYETIRFWTMSVAEYLDEYFETDVIKASTVRQRHHRHGPRHPFARHGLRAPASLHGRGRRQRRDRGATRAAAWAPCRKPSPAPSEPTAANCAPRPASTGSW